MTNKTISKIAQSIIDITISKAEIYPTGVARCLGNIESIIESAFNENIPADKVVEEIEERLSEIERILSYVAIKKAREEREAHDH